MRILFLLVFLTNLNTLTAQRCPCSRNLDFLIKKVEKNYAGFQDKVTTANKAEYREHTDRFVQAAQTIKEDSSCIRHCIDWARWFKDRHLILQPIGASKMIRATPLPFSLSSIDSQTMLLVLPSMNGTYANLVDSMMRTQEAQLRSKPYLIVDCRNNKGGSDRIWWPLKPYLYTQTVVTDGSLYWASEDNARFVGEIMKRDGVSKGSKRYYKKLIADMKKTPGQFVGTMNVRREHMEMVTPFPQKVVVLVDNHSASSTENFVLWARQSKKVTIMGQQTAGVVDYGNPNVISSPCRDWELWVPTIRSNRVADGRALDNVGILPEISLEADTTDWIESAKTRLREKK